MKLEKILLFIGLSALSVAAFSDTEKENQVAQTLITNAHVWDGTSDGITKKVNVLVENNLIKKIRAEVSDAHAEATIIDAHGKVLMPGLIDTHTHIAAPEQLERLMDDVDWMYWGISAAQVTEDWLMRGYTTVRDAGGPASSIHKAVEDGRLIGPRIYSSGQVISQTSGHGDHRHFNTPHPNFQGNHGGKMQSMDGFELICDGVDEVLRCTREVLRQGATQIKIMAGGGTSSNFGPLYTMQYLPEEIEAAVRAAADYGTYVMVHAYHDESIIRSLDAGVRSIEHGTLMTEKGMEAIMEKDAWISPYFTVLSLPFEVVAAYVGPENVDKSKQVIDGARNQLRILKESGYEKIAFGADVVGPLSVQQTANNEFAVRAEYWTPVEVLKQATYNNGRMLKEETGLRNPYQEGDLGVIREGAYADMIIVDGNPLTDISLLTRPKESIDLIMKDGVIYKNTL
ncbi:amidohydrolase family protein [Halioglobus maricola]|uniref:Amidohydrolase family protein n=1 Tax=Halioglobus maricola TaxID=2601894 RepID=A0A5P9NL81_9GAMM|nr:amidohydrolase family protein [Halioglobus maricola]QFU76256.1 amidohydrolase family protein [Halioglobus maricola]